MVTIRAPFPWFGGKREVAFAVWERFGDVPNYVEPFFGSGAVLLARPGQPGTETVNDLDGLLCNAWRAIAGDPEGVARAAKWPVSECDLTARHLALVSAREGLTERLIADPRHFDAELAGWWVWGACCWIGGGWCSGAGPWVLEGGEVRRISDGNKDGGVRRRIPHLGDAGRGVNRQLHHLGNAGTGVNGSAPVLETMRALSARLSRVRICCGDWRRVLTPVVTWRHGTTAMFLDPPYAEGDAGYAAGGAGVAADVAAWCREHGDDRRLRIALCGHEDEHDLPGWSVLPWKARGGYGNQGGEDADDNRHRETIWFSPGCLGAQQRSLF